MLKGELCDQEVDHCVSVTCQNGGHCVVNEDQSVTCSCVPGFAGIYNNTLIGNKSRLKVLVVP